MSKDGKPAANYTLNFQASGCDENSFTQKTTGSDGQAEFTWQLNGLTGKQVAKIVALDDKKQRLDSINASATGIKTTRGYVRSACVPDAPTNTLCRLPNGRLLATFYDDASLYYSDDIGISWHKMASTLSFLRTDPIVSTPTGDLFITTPLGLYFSKDGGKSWDNRNPASVPSTSIKVIYYNYTRSGKLIAVINTDDNKSTAWVSSDKGVSWIKFSAPITSLNYDYIDELSNGDFLLLTDNSQLYGLNSTGNQWRTVFSNPLRRFSGFVVANDGTMYASIQSQNTANLNDFVKSVDNGLNFTTISSNRYSAMKFSILTDGTICFIRDFDGIYKFIAPNTFIKLSPADIKSVASLYLYTGSNLLFNYSDPNSNTWPKLYVTIP
ncbi:VPS10 domain-containing protein [Mucilaginibacter koreensis]